MMEDEHAILNHYNLTSPYPTEWPDEKDDSDASDDVFSADASIRPSKSRSRYSALERSGSDRRSLVPGSEKTGDGVENLVQKDEADPLGSADSVVRVLRQKGIAVEDDQRLRELRRHWRWVALVDLVQEIAFFYPLQLSHPLCTYLKCIPMLLRSHYCKDLTFSPAPSTKNQPL